MGCSLRSCPVPVRRPDISVINGPIARSYGGGFAVHAAAGGASHVVAVDSSARALAAAARNAALNGLAERIELIERDVGRFLREREETFELLVLDPPALVKQRKDLPRGSRAYKDLQL